MSFSGLQFLSWQWLLLIPLLWAYLLWWHQHKTKTNQTSSIVDIDLSSYNHFYHPLADKLIKASKAQPLSGNIFWKQADFWWYGIILSLLIVALAHPALIGKRLPDPPPERDIIFLVDTSVSMQLKDYQQDGIAIKRIEVLRNLLDEFTTKMKGEKISVILFAEQAYVLVPLSNDQSLIRQMLRRITSTLAGRYTAVGDALLMALNEAKKQEINNQTKRHQTFILFTDADSSRGQVSSEAAAEIIAEYQIPVFTIAIGSSQKDNDKKIQGGLYQSVDLALLEDIAKRTKGNSYQVNDAEAMQKALQSILKQRQNIAKPKPQYERQVLYFYPLFIGLLLLSLFQALRLYRAQSILMKETHHE